MRQLHRIIWSKSFGAGGESSVSFFPTPWFWWFYKDFSIDKFEETLDNCETLQLPMLVAKFWAWLVMCWLLTFHSIAYNEECWETHCLCHCKHSLALFLRLTQSLLLLHLNCWKFRPVPGLDGQTDWAMTYTMRCTTTIIDRDHINYKGILGDRPELSKSPWTLKLEDW